MTFRRSPQSSACRPQIAPRDVAEIAALGFRSIMCNRPDGEALDQTPAGDPPRRPIVAACFSPSSR